MADPLLDIAALTAPIPGANPAGARLSPAVREQLEEARKEDDASNYGENDPRRPQVLKKADWPGIVKLATKTLTQESKDLLVTARLTEALVRLHGFAGLREGMHLLRVLVEDCWDRINPPIEDGDLEVRAGPFVWLDIPDKGSRFPNTLRGVPVVFGQGGAFSWLDWKMSEDGRGTVTRDDFNKAILETPPERIQNITDDISKSFQELTNLTRVLGEKLGPDAPGLTGVQQALHDCHVLAQEVWKQTAPADGQVEGAAAAAASGQPGTGSAARTAASRDEAYKQLYQAAVVLQRLEPHSPIPYLVQRAVELGKLPFPDLIKALIRDSNVISELNRELGIKEQEAAPQ